MQVRFALGGRSATVRLLEIILLTDLFDKCRSLATAYHLGERDFLLVGTLGDYLVFP